MFDILIALLGLMNLKKINHTVGTVLDSTDQIVTSVATQIKAD